MAPPNRAYDERIQPCQTRDCDRIATCSASANGRDWYNLCNQCWTAFSHAASDLDAGWSVQTPPYEGEHLAEDRRRRAMNRR